MIGRLGRSRWTPYAVALAPMLVLVAVQAANASDPSATANDWSLLEIATRSAGALDRLLGPYSRYEWSHPGPTFFYLAAPVHAVTGGQLGGLTLAAALVNTAAVAGIVAAAGRTLGRRGAWAAAIVLLAFYLRYDVERLREVWNPTLTVVPTALVMVLAAGVASGWRWALPALAAASSFVVQLHIGTVPTVATVAAAGAIAGLALDRDRSRWLLPVGLTVVVIGAMWALPVYEEVTREPGNLSQITEFAAESEGGQHPVPEVSSLVLQLTAGVQRDLGHHAGPASVTAARPPTDAWDGLAVAGSALILAAGWRRGSRVHGMWLALAALGGATSIYGGTAVDGELHPYLLAYATGVGLFLHIGAASVALAALADATRSWTRWAGAVTPLAAAGGGVVALAVLAAGFVAADARSYAVQQRSDVVPELEEGFAALDVPTSRRVRVSIGEPSRWPYAAGLLNELEDDGYDTAVDDDWIFMFGDDHAPAAGDLVVLVDEPSTELPPGHRTLATTAPARLSASASAAGEPEPATG